MKILNLTMWRSAIFGSSIKVPDNMTKQEAIAYAKAHKSEASLGTLEYTLDSDIIDEENCKFDE